MTGAGAAGAADLGAGGLQHGSGQQRDTQGAARDEAEGASAVPAQPHDATTRHTVHLIILLMKLLIACVSAFLKLCFVSVSVLLFRRLERSCRGGGRRA